MITVTVEVTGKDKALSQLDNLKKILGNFRQEMQRAGDYYLDFLINTVFATQGSVFQEPWKPLDPHYARQKERKWGSTSILVASGRMRASWRLYTATDYLIVRNEAVNERGEFYARKHQDGEKYMPQRMLIKFDSIRTRKIRDIIVDSLNDRIKNL